MRKVKQSKKPELMYIWVGADKKSVKVELLFSARGLCTVFDEKDLMDQQDSSFVNFQLNNVHCFYMKDVNIAARNLHLI